MTDTPAPRRLLAPWLVFGAAFLVYLLTACRTLYTGDDGDFAAAISTLGITHPTGYPLFTLGGKLWLTLTPFLGEVPFRLNVLTALCGAAAVGGLCQFLTELLTDAPWSGEIAASVSFLFAFSPTLWSQSTSCEVYALNTLFLCLLLLYALRFVRAAPGDGADRLLCRLALLYGFALCNHLSIALFFPAFAVLVVWRKPSLFGKHFAVLLAVAGCVLLPLSLYAYLPLAAKYSASPEKWGQPDTPAAFWYHLTGAQYRDLMWASADVWRIGFARYLTDYLPGEYGAFLLFVAAIGAVALVSRPQTRPVAWLLISVFVANVVYAAGYAIPDIFVYYLPSYVAVAVFIAGAVSAGVALLQTRLQWDEPATRRYAFLALPIALVSVATAASTRYAQNDKSLNRAEADYAQSILRSCPPDTLLAVRGSVLSSLQYYQTVEKQRTDVTVVSQDMFGGVVVSNRWYRKHLRDRDARIEMYLPTGLPGKSYDNGEALTRFLLNAHRAGRPVLVVPTPDLAATLAEYEKARRDRGLPAPLPDWWLAEQAVNKMFVRVPWGLCERLYLPGTAPALAEQFALTAPVWLGEPSIAPDYDRLVIARDADPLQTPIFFRFHESLAAWGAQCEAAHRPDLAAPAYARALSLYDSPALRAGLDRTKKR